MARGSENSWACPARTNPFWPPGERKKVLRIAAISLRIFSVMGELAHEYRQASRVDDLFLEHANETLAAEDMEDWARSGEGSSAGTEEKRCGR